MILESTAFRDGGDVPRRYTCDGEDASPPLAWREVPEGTRTLVLMVEDPDAPKGTWIHWVVFNLPTSIARLPEAASGSGGLPTGAVEGTNSWARLGYGGPCPPSGSHRYFFRLFALDCALALSPGATAEKVARAREGHVLAEATLMARYARGRASGLSA
jgi:Raf kinase inhibitor-like YbhB/YbcL family protein